MSDYVPIREAMTIEAICDAIQRHVGGCREWLESEANNCWQPAEYVLWGKLVPSEGLGPRCYEHAAQHVGSGHALTSGSNYALIHVMDLAREIAAALNEVPE